MKKLNLLNVTKLIKNEISSFGTKMDSPGACT